MATHFTALDWSIVVLYVGATLAAGLYGRKFVGGIGDFLVAGRELGTFIGIATLAATEIGLFQACTSSGTRRSSMGSSPAW